MDKFHEIYCIESSRLKNWDYGSNASYFVTICTGGRQCILGEIVDSEMVLNDVGKISQSIWSLIPLHFPFVKLGVFVVMPNHIHGIVQINNMDKTIDSGVGRDAINRVSTIIMKRCNEISA